MKKEALVFLGGAAIGAALGVAASKFLDSEMGKDLKENVSKTVKDFYDFLAPKLKNIQKLTKAKYKEIVSEGAKEYGKAKKLSEKSVKELIEKTMAFWDNLTQEEGV